MGDGGLEFVAQIRGCIRITGGEIVLEGGEKRFNVFLKLNRDFRFKVTIFSDPQYPTLIIFDP